MNRILMVVLCLAAIGCGEKLPRTAHITNVGKSEWCAREFAGLTEYLNGREVSPDKIIGMIVGSSGNDRLDAEAYEDNIRHGKKIAGYLQVVTPQNELLEVQFWDAREEVIPFVKESGMPFFRNYHVIVEFSPNPLNGLDYYSIKEFTPLAKCLMNHCSDGVTRFAFTTLK